MFVEMLTRKAEAVGGSVTAFSTRKTKLSQIDHTTGICTKKPLSQREHVFPDGNAVQRDLYSAFLARFVNDDTLDISQAELAWASAEPLLRRAMSRDSEQSVRGRGFCLPHVARGNADSVRTACTRNPKRCLCEVVDAVAAVQAAVGATKNTKQKAKRQEHREMLLI